MKATLKPGRVNVKVLIILLLTTGILGGGAAVVYKVRKRIVADRALAAGKAALDAEDWAEACKQLKFYLSKYPDDEEMLVPYGEANLAVRPPKVGAAIGAFRRLLRLRGPSDDETCERLADLYTRIGDFSEAAHICRERRKVDPSDPDAALRLGQALLALGQLDEATAVLGALVTAHPEQVKAYGFLSLLAQQKRSESATEMAAGWLDAGVEANPQSAEARAQRAHFRRVVMNDRKAAREDLRAADALQPDDPTVLLSLAEDWMALGNLQEARVELAAVERVDLSQIDRWDMGPDAFALARLTTAGMLALLQPDEGEARAELVDKGLNELTGRHRMAFLPIAIRLYLADGSASDARRVLDEFRDAVSKFAANDPSLKVRLTLIEASVTDAEGKPYETIGLLEPLVAKNVEYPQAWKMLGGAYSRIGQDRRSLETLEEYVRRVPADVGVLMLLAKALRGNDPEKSERYAVQAERLMTEGAVGSESWPALDRKLVLIEAGLAKAAASRDADRVRQFSAELAALRESHPGVADIYILEAMVAAYEDHGDDVIRLLEEAIVNAEDKLAPALKLAQYFRWKERFEDAVKTYERAITISPDLAMPRVSLYQLLVEKLDRRQQGRDILETAVADLEGSERLRAEVTLAQCIFLGGDEEEGIDRIRQLAAKHPTNPEMPLLLLNIPKISGDLVESQRQVDALKSIEGDLGLRWRLEQAKLWLRSDDWKQKAEEIEDLLTQCHVADPGWRDAALMLGTLYERLDDREKAEQTFRRWLQINPADTFVVDRLLRLLEVQGRFAEASYLLDTKRGNAQAADIVLAPHRTILAIGQRDYDVAIKELERLVAANPKDVDSRVTLAKLLSSVSNDVDRAIALLDEAMALMNENQRLGILDTKAQILWQADRRPETLELLDSEVEKHSDFVAYLLRSKYLSAAGQFERAEEDCKHLTTFEDSATEGYRLLGLFYAQHDRMKDAITAFESGLAIAVDNPILKAGLTKVCLSSESETDRERGRKLLDELLAETPDDPALRFLRARVLQIERTDAANREAAAILEGIIQDNPRAINAYLDLIRLARAEGDIEKASEAVTRGLGANRNNSLLLLEKANLELGQNHPLLAREPAQQVLKQDPRNVVALNLLASAALQAGDIPAAAAHNETALAFAPDNADARMIHAMLLNAKGRHNEEAQVLEALVKTETGSAMIWAHIALAELRLLTKDFDAAKKLLDEAAALAPANVMVLGTQVKLLAAQADFDGLAELLTARLAEHPRYTAIVLDGATLLAGMGGADFLEKAKSLVAQVLSHDPTSVAAHGTMARLAFQAADHDACIEAYRKVLELEPENSEALNDLAWLLAEEKDEAEAALELANRGVGRHPSDTHLRDTRGVVLHKLGKLEAAKADFATCIELIGNSENPAELRTRGQAQFHLGRVLTELGEIEEARDNLTAALDLDARIKIFSDQERAELKTLLDSGER